MKLGYIHFDRSEQKKYMAVINRLSIGGAIDELGVGRIRDHYSDEMFPGISSLHQHAKYFILLPLLYRKAITYKYHRLQDVRPQIVKLEKDLTKVLYENSTIKTGITGSEFIDKKDYVRYDPTYIYATGLSKFGILLCDSLEEMIFTASKKYHDRPVKLNASDDEDGDSNDLYNSYQFFHAPTDLGYDWEKDSSLDLNARESEFLIKHICGSKLCQNSLLTHILDSKLSLEETETFESFVEKYSASLPENLADTIKKARYFAKLVDGLYNRYNYLFSDRTDDKQREKFLAWVEKDFKNHKVEMIESIKDLKIHDNGSIPFCLQAIKAIEDRDYDALDNLIVRRERWIKRTRSKIGNNAYEYRPDSPIHNYTLQFRWGTVRTMVGEIYKGLENG